MGEEGSRATGARAGAAAQAEVARELAARKAFLQGCDREGHPVLIVWAARHDMGDRAIEETKRFICYCLDNSVAIADPALNPGGQVKCLFDLSGTRLRTPPPCRRPTCCSLCFHGSLMISHANVNLGAQENYRYWQ